MGACHPGPRRDSLPLRFFGTRWRAETLPRPDGKQVLEHQHVPLPQPRLRLRPRSEPPTHGCTKRSLVTATAAPSTAAFRWTGRCRGASRATSSRFSPMWGASTGRRRRFRRTGCFFGEGVPGFSNRVVRCRRHHKGASRGCEPAVHRRFDCGDRPETLDRRGRRNCRRLSMRHRLRVGERSWHGGRVPLSGNRGDQALRPAMAPRRPSSSPSSFAMRSRSCPISACT